MEIHVNYLIEKEDNGQIAVKFGYQTELVGLGK